MCPLSPDTALHSSQTWKQQDSGALFPVAVQGLAAESEARAEPLAEAQGAVGPGPSRAGGDLEGGVAEIPLQQPLPQPPAQGGGRLGSAGAAAMQTFILRGAGGSQQLRGVCGERWEGSEETLLSLEPRRPSLRCVPTHFSQRGSEMLPGSPAYAELGRHISHGPPVPPGAAPGPQGSRNLRGSGSGSPGSSSSWPEGCCWRHSPGVGTGPPGLGEIGFCPEFQVLARQRES